MNNLWMDDSVIWTMGCIGLESWCSKAAKELSAVSQEVPDSYLTFAMNSVGGLRHWIFSPNATHKLYNTCFSLPYKDIKMKDSEFEGQTKPQHGCKRWRQPSSFRKDPRQTFVKGKVFVAQVSVVAAE